jgi:hypothetical protein
LILRVLNPIEDLSEEETAILFWRVCSDVAQIQTAKRVYPGRQSSVIVWSSPRLTGRNGSRGRAVLENLSAFACQQ